MSEVAIRNEHALALPESARSLVEWAQEAQAANQIAVSLCKTVFAPEHFRNKPDDATAAILYGSELGMSPNAALKGIYVIGGKPALYAGTMMGMVLGRGHEVWTEAASDTKVEVRGRRKGSSHVEVSVWTIERARKAGYTRNKKYETEPQAMLLARAQADVCRRIAPDVLLGMASTVEELESEGQGTATTTASEPPRRMQRASAQRMDVPAPPLEQEVQEQWRPSPNAEAVPVADVSEAVEITDEDELTAARTATEPQVQKLQILMRKFGLETRDEKVAAVAQLASRPDLTSSKDLTLDEATFVIDTLERLSYLKRPPLALTVVLSLRNATRAQIAAKVGQLETAEIEPVEEG